MSTTVPPRRSAAILGPMPAEREPRKPGPDGSRLAHSFAGSGDEPPPAGAPIREDTEVGRPAWAKAFENAPAPGERIGPYE